MVRVIIRQSFRLVGLSPAAEVSLNVESMMSAQQSLKSKWSGYRQRGMVLLIVYLLTSLMSIFMMHLLAEVALAWKTIAEVNDALHSEARFFMELNNKAKEKHLPNKGIFIADTLEFNCRTGVTVVELEHEGLVLSLGFN